MYVSGTNPVKLQLQESKFKEAGIFHALPMQLLRLGSMLTTTRFRLRLFIRRNIGDFVGMSPVRCRNWAFHVNVSTNNPPYLQPVETLG